MIDVPYQDGGALLSGSPVYIEREADQEAAGHLQKMDYLSLIEPRQQGKTSMINHLMGQFRPLGYVFAYSDLTTLDKTSESSWYQSLCDWVLSQTDSISSLNPFATVSNGSGWLRFLRGLADNAQRTGIPLVLILDEIGATPAAWGTQFFSVIRSVYNSRENMPCFRYLTFIVAGAYNPRDLIKDPVISNFNVDHRVPLSDFDSRQLSKLASHLAPGEQAEALAERLQFWTSGQPFISQRLCRYLAKLDLAFPTTLDLMVERFIQNDTSHLPRIQAYFDEKPELRDYARQIISTRAKFSPSINPWQFQLSHVIGILSADDEGCCQIRNRVYEAAFPELITAARVFSVTVDRSKIDKENSRRQPEPFVGDRESRFRPQTSLCDVSRTYALAIGIASYRHISPLGKTATDAQDVRDTLITQGYPLANVGMLLDGQATKSAISEKLNWLAGHAGPNDTVVIFFSGHGVQFIGGFWPGEYLCPVEADLSKPKDTLITQEEFTAALRSIKAGRLVVFLDACHAGGIGEPKDASFLVKAGFSESGYDKLATGNGRVIIASCRPDEYSWEIYGLRNSLFTHYLLGGIRGEAADVNGQVWISRLFGHVYQEVSRRKNQHPFQKAETEDFVIAVTSKSTTD